MKTLISLSLILSLAASTCLAQSSDVYTRHGIKLTFISQDTSFSPVEKSKLIETFFTVYPQLIKAYNKKSSRNVTFVIDTAYTGVAATSDDRVVFSSRYMKAHPKDIDVVTHEVMHIVQAYGGNSGGPGWLTEGIADYARSKYGVDNAGSHWTMPAWKATQNYDNSYRVTARFLTWLEEKVKAGIVKDFDSQLRAGTFTDASWKTETGKTLDTLWADYSANPAI